MFEKIRAAKVRPESLKRNRDWMVPGSRAETIADTVRSGRPVKRRCPPPNPPTSNRNDTFHSRQPRSSVRERSRHHSPGGSVRPARRIITVNNVRDEGVCLFPFKSVLFNSGSDPRPPRSPPRARLRTNYGGRPFEM